MLRRELPQVHPAFQLEEATTQSALVEAYMVRERLLAVLSAFFAVLATILAMVGLYGVLNYAVAQRTKEIGLRMALGASASQVVGLVVRDVLLMVLAGLGTGVVAGLAVSRYLATLLYGIQSTDSLAVALPLGCLLGAALLASFPPARRATKVDPMVALRYE